MLLLCDMTSLFFCVVQPEFCKKRIKHHCFKAYLGAQYSQEGSRSYFHFFFGAKDLSPMTWEPGSHTEIAEELGFQRHLEITGTVN